MRLAFLLILIAVGCGKKDSIAPPATSVAQPVAAPSKKAETAKPQPPEPKTLPPDSEYGKSPKPAPVATNPTQKQEPEKPAVDYESMKSSWEAKDKALRAEKVKELEIAKKEIESTLKELEDDYAKQQAYSKSIQDKGLADRRAAQKKLDEILKKIESVKDGVSRSAKAVTTAESTQILPYMHLPSLRTGDFGPVEFATYPTHQRISIGVRQVIDNETAIVWWGDDTFYAHLPPGDYVDGKIYRSPKWVHCLGTKTYKTVIGGSKTVKEIRLLN